jgi:hypothetical protein
VSSEERGSRVLSRGLLNPLLNARFKERGQNGLAAPPATWALFTFYFFANETSLAAERPRPRRGKTLFEPSHADSQVNETEYNSRRWITRLVRR